jgi:hypothetical protein
MQMPTKNTLPKDNVPAKIVEVKPSDLRKGTGFGDTHVMYEHGAYCVVETRYGARYTLRNHSMNGFDVDQQKVGLKGYVSWMRSTSYSLPYFHTTKK